MPQTGGAGPSWTIAWHQDPTPDGGDGSGSFCVTATYCWMVGDYTDSSGNTRPLIEVTHGDGWSIAALPDMYRGLYSVSCADGSDCWAVGDAVDATTGADVALHFNGSAWSEAVVPTVGEDRTLRGVSCPTATVCWAAGFYDGPNNKYTLVEQYANGSWSVVSSPNTRAYPVDDLSGISCVSATECWAVGTRWISTPQYDTWHTLTLHLTQGSWAIVPSPDTSTTNPDYLFGVTCVSTTECWAVGTESNYPGPDGTLVEQYTASGWAIVSSPSPANSFFNDLWAVACPGGSDCWAVGSYSLPGGGNQTLIEHYSGSAWSIVNSPDTSSAYDQVLTGIACEATGACAAVGYAANGAVYASLIVTYGVPEPPPPARFSTSSAQQYTLDGSDGSTWSAVDVPGLAVTFTASSDSTAVFTANADLWTEAAGFNQDLGVCVVTRYYSPAPCSQPLAWHESGGFAGTFSPNAAAVQATAALSAGTQYTAFLVWKSNMKMPSGDRIHIAAGTAGGGFSPTSLSVQLFPGGTPVTTAVSRQQYTMHGSDGRTWQPVDGSALSTTIAPATTATYELTANADLWTADSGFNQDVGINVSPACANDSGNTLAVWKESGGSAGTYSPNAAFAQTVCVMNSGTSYTVSLVWKANESMPTGDTIAVGAGPSGGSYSPTSLVATQEPAGNVVTGTVSTAQYQLNGSDGSSWHPVDASTLVVTVTPSTSCAARLTGNADLWTQSAGFNQDVGIEVIPAGGGGTIAAWKESGGFAGTFSPNAAFVQGTFDMVAGTQYTVALVWKANTSMPAGDVIQIGAGPIGVAYSPTSLMVDLNC
ncbi:MAG: hypothetical protein JOZ75_01695 [Candidatus Dormibacteraeota bacterium]|nr:hypothetical protein [Candidatus Dormibacteraeota bacterium]